jgi:uncharacterized membrane protein (UPF0127 family)
MALLRNSTTGSIVATRVDLLTGFFQRAIGLLARTSVQRDEGVWLSSCRSIHTLGMRYAIDVMFVDSDGFVLRIERDVCRIVLLSGAQRQRASSNSAAVRSARSTS